MKKIISFFIIASLIIGGFPTGAFAASGEKTDVKSRSASSAGGDIYIQNTLHF